MSLTAHPNLTKPRDHHQFRSYESSILNCSSCWSKVRNWISISACHGTNTLIAGVQCCPYQPTDVRNKDTSTALIKPTDCEMVSSQEIRHQPSPQPTANNVMSLNVRNRCFDSSAEVPKLAHQISEWLTPHYDTAHNPSYHIGLYRQRIIHAPLSRVISRSSPRRDEVLSVLKLCGRARSDCYKCVFSADPATRLPNATTSAASACRTCRNCHGQHQRAYQPLSCV